MVYDIFISYRRDGGGATAGRIYDSLMRDGYSVSYDVDTLREGRFDKQLLERIEQCQDFILVVDKNCFERTIDPSTNPEEDWLWQELSYALRLKKNIIPILQAGAKFPKKLPEDIDHVRFSNGPVYSHEYFDEFYKKLRDDFLRAYPRLAKIQYDSSISSTNKLPNLKLKADADCVFYLDGEERAHLKAGVIQKFPLAQGEYELMFVSEDNGNDRLEMEFEMPNVDKLQKVNLNEVRTVRQQKEAETKRIAEEKRQAEEKRRTEEERKRREEEERPKFNVKGVDFRMIKVEGGSFWMGAQKVDSSGKNFDAEAWDGENPLHKVTLSSFYMGEVVVTQALWKAVMESEPTGNGGWESQYGKGDNYSAYRVSYNDIVNDFLPKLNRLTGKNFRLPTEAEWEYAARGGKKSLGYKYSGSNTIDDVAWYYNNSGSATHPVKGKKPNELGLYDMSGNVWEWCQDWYGTYSSSEQTNPNGPSSGSHRVLRGGSWGIDAGDCRVSNRFNYYPAFRSIYVGFRLALPQ